MSTPTNRFEPVQKRNIAPKSARTDMNVAGSLPLTPEAFAEFCKQEVPKMDNLSKSKTCVIGTKW